MGACSWSPPKGGQGRSTHRVEVAEEVPSRDRKQQSMAVAVVDVTIDKNGNDLRNKKGGKILENGPDCQGVNACLNKGNVAVTRVMDSTRVEGNLVGPISDEGGAVLKTSGENGVGSSQNGLIKPRPKWNRLLRMECGPVEEVKGELATSLGKISVLAILEEVNADSMGMHGLKQGKTQEVLEVIAEARVSEHPCLSQ